LKAKLWFPGAEYFEEADGEGVELVGSGKESFGFNAVKHSYARRCIQNCVVVASPKLRILVAP